MKKLYTMDGCMKCFKAKKQLESQNIEFREINILQTPQAPNQLKDLIGEVYVPVLVTNNKVIKGLDIIEYLEHDHL
ncbi:glutaredoxin family protein [Pontibacillus sp. HMF3514]|uniref:glutaredoxin family protein n=1 Tax=Pontibacillus sp. HMF3514 TaxID=2692425 RepID=UPI00131FFC3C|nr:glutaredoxin family protein [Pontibacillus sp. HMF3514]QHE50791.1 NrdH-redoxin [Pontibacillus sp. HMF3514]